MVAIMSKGNQFTAEQVIEAIKASGGIVTTVARKMGCDWHTARKYIDNYPTIGQAYKDECESVLDMCESALFTNIKTGDTSDAKWFLSKRGKHRGYGDQVDVRVPDGIVVKGYTVLANPDQWPDPPKKDTQGVGQGDNATTSG